MFIHANVHRPSESVKISSSNAMAIFTSRNSIETVCWARRVSISLLYILDVCDRGSLTQRLFRCCCCNSAWLRMTKELSNRLWLHVQKKE